MRAIAVPMKREVSPLADAVALFRLLRVLRRIKPDIVNAGTPKAGLLGVLAARICGVKVVVYLLRGLRFEGAKGAKRLLLAATEHVAAGAADRVFANSESLRDWFPVALPLRSGRRRRGFPVSGVAPTASSSSALRSKRREKREQACARERRRLGIQDDASSWSASSDASHATRA